MPHFNHCEHALINLLYCEVYHKNSAVTVGLTGKTSGSEPIAAESGDCFYEVFKAIGFGNV